jgi:hypothetical protein
MTVGAAQMKSFSPYSVNDGVKDFICIRIGKLGSPCPNADVFPSLGRLAEHGPCLWRVGPLPLRLAIAVGLLLRSFSLRIVACRCFSHSL